MKTRTKIRKVLKEQVGNEEKYISREKLVMESYNYDKTRVEDYTTPPSGWDGYSILSQMRNNGLIKSTQDGCSYFIKSI